MLEIQDLKDFSISNWYKLFENVTLKTIILSIPDEIFKIIQSGDNETDIKEVSPDFHNSVTNALNTFDNNLFAKNNWHAPVDAKMFSFGYTLKVSNIPDLLMLFNASNIIQNDFDTIKEIDFCFAFKPWICIHPASEFRCIVINNILRGITPRDWPTFYDHFNTDGSQIIETIFKFFNEKIKSAFPRRNYTFDVFLSYPNIPILLDFGILNSKTNLYAFSWTEISPLLNKNCPDEVAPVFRYLESDIGIMTKTEAVQKISKAT